MALVENRSTTASGVMRAVLHKARALDKRKSHKISQDLKSWRKMSVLPWLHQGCRRGGWHSQNVAPTWLFLAVFQCRVPAPRWEQLSFQYRVDVNCLRQPEMIQVRDRFLRSLQRGPSLVTTSKANAGPVQSQGSHGRSEQFGCRQGGEGTRTIESSESAKQL